MTRLVVVGGSGFLGRAVVRRAQARGLDVRATGRELDLGDAPGAVVVGAAGLLGGDDDALARANADLPARLARLCLEQQHALLHVGSAAEYGEPAGPLMREQDEPAPLSPYGRTKLAGTRAVTDLRAHGLVATVARVFNVVGGYDVRDDPVSGFARQVLAVGDGGTVTVGDPTLVRDLAGVDWVADRLLDLVDHVGRHDLVNVCTGRGTSFGEVVASMAAELGKRVTVVGTQPGGLPRAVGDPARLRELLGADAEPETPQQVARAALLSEADLTSARRG